MSLGEKIITDWYFSWMKQDDYRAHAMNVDANMRYHLAELVDVELARERQRGRVDGLREAANRARAEWVKWAPMRSTEATHRARTAEFLTTWLETRANETEQEIKK